MSDEKDRVFISYADEDYEMAKKLYDDLKKADINVYLDRENLLPGENREKTIIKTINDKTSCFLFLVSDNSVPKRSSVLKQLNTALEVRKEIPEDQLFIIPVKLDKTDIPDNLKTIHYADISCDKYEKGLKSILRSLNKIDRNKVPRNKLLRINVLIVSMNEKEATELWKTDEELLSIFNKHNISDCYSSFRNEWKPYPGYQSHIGEIINEAIESLKLIPNCCTKDFFDDKKQFEKWSELKNKIKNDSDEYLIIIVDALSLLNYKLRDDLHQASLWWGERIRIYVFIANCDKKDVIKEKIESWLKVPYHRKICEIDIYKNSIILRDWLDKVIQNIKNKKKTGKDSKDYFRK